jgi:RNA recognition motif-containing protein
LKLFKRQHPRLLGDDFTGRPAAPAAEGDAGPSGSAPSRGLSKSAQKILKAQKQPPAPTLFLGNLGFETTEGSIRELFEAHRSAKKAVEQKITGGGGEENGTGEKDGKEKNDKDKSGAERSDKEKSEWIRKIRMGTFEDSGKCKGCVEISSLSNAA